MTGNKEIDNMYKSPESNVDGNQYYINGIAASNIKVSRNLESNRTFGFIVVLLLMLFFSLIWICISYFEYNLLAKVFLYMTPIFFIAAYSFLNKFKPKLVCENCGNPIERIDDDESIRITRTVAPKLLGHPILYYCQSCNLYWHADDYIPDD